jgi:predicted pyridoxine 5'-phosphate oxidase superfamily flavin-nucleotide-binding protein
MREAAMDIPMFHAGSRHYQERFGSRKLADRLVERLARNRFTDEDRAFIESRPFFMLATADDQGRPDCSYKGGLPGFVQVIDPATLAFPSYDGNGMFKSLGNLHVNPQVGMLFIDFDSPERLRLNGRALASDTDPLLASFPGATVVVRFTPEAIFPNCPRYLHKMPIVEMSAYAPEEGKVPPVPNWKLRPEFNEVLPAGDPARSTVANKKDKGTSD